MRGTGAGWDSWAYRLFVIGGLIGILSVVILLIDHRRSLTCIGARIPPFKISSQAGKLVTEGDPPDAVRASLKGLRRARLWQGVEIWGTPKASRPSVPRSGRTCG
jgi:hypothetical protein